MARWLGDHVHDEPEGWATAPSTRTSTLAGLSIPSQNACMNLYVPQKPGASSTSGHQSPAPVGPINSFPLWVDVRLPSNASRSGTGIAASTNNRIRAARRIIGAHSARAASPSASGGTMDTLKEHLDKDLAELRAAGLYKTERVIASPQGAQIRVP